MNETSDNDKPTVRISNRFHLADDAIGELSRATFNERTLRNDKAFLGLVKSLRDTNFAIRKHLNQNYTWNYPQ
jgi:hypothetical protein